VIALEECWHTAVVERPGSAIMVTLADVSFVNAAGRVLLTRMCRQGVAFVATGVLIESIVEEIKADAGRSSIISK
jgi:hypothetical protein